MGDRRFERRFSREESAEVRWKDATGAEARAIARLKDVSQSGASLILDRPIRMGSVVAVVFGGREHKGDVRYSTSRNGEYLIGIEFDQMLA